MNSATVSRQEKARAILELVFAGNLWGFGFVATVWTLSGMGPLWLTSIRFGLALLPAIPLYFLARGRAQGPGLLATLRYSFLPGFCLGLFLVLQTWGLRYTSATKSGFITTLYVVFVPVFERIFFRTRLTLVQGLCVFVALAGTALIANARDFGSLNIGDLLTLFCSLGATLHILAIARYGKQIPSAINFNLGQSFWAGLLPLGFAIAFEAMPNDPYSWKPLFGLLYLAFGSTFVAFMIQVRAQKKLNPTVVSMLFLLESPFAAAYAFLLLGERMDFSQWMGALLIVVAVVASAREETRKQNAPSLAIVP